KVFRFNFARHMAPLMVYVVVIAAVCTVAMLRSRAMPVTTGYTPTRTPSEASSDRPYFSLSTHRTFGTNESARLWVDFRHVDHLDFRVYQVKDPSRFFAGLKNPHQMGEREEEEIATQKSRPSLLERVRTFKRWALAGIKDYVRTQLAHDSRQAFNNKFRAEEPSRRTPLNTADYARVPLLNPN